MCNPKTKAPKQHSSCCTAGLCMKTLQNPDTLLEFNSHRRGWKTVTGVILAITALCYLLIILISTPALVFLQEKLGMWPNISGSICDNCSKFKFKFIIGEENACKVTDNIFLLIMVPSHHANVVSRNTIRKTWGSITQYKGLQVRTKFVFGIHEDKNLNNQLQHEQKLHKDIVQVDVPEKFKKLTEKSVAAFTWAAKYCSKAQFVMKSDDDSFNYIQRFIRFLSEENSNPMSDPFIGCRFLTVMPDRRPTSKYYVPPERYPDQYYPVYSHGPVYALSNFAMKQMLQVIPNVRYLFLEDVYLTGFVRVAAGIRYTMIPGLLVAKETIGDCDLATWVTNTHQISPAEMQSLWDRAVTVGETSGCRTRDLYIMFVLNTVCVSLILFGLIFLWKRSIRKRRLSGELITG